MEQLHSEIWRGMPKAVCMKVTLSGCSSFTIPSPFPLCLQFFTSVTCSSHYYRYSAVNTLKTSITLSRRLTRRSQLVRDASDSFFALFFSNNRLWDAVPVVTDAFLMERLPHPLPNYLLQHVNTRQGGSEGIHLQLKRPLGFFPSSALMA